VPDSGILATFIAVVLGLFLIPGPAVLLTLARAASGGRRVGVATGLGIATGDLVHTAMATVGLSALLMTSALAFQIVKYLGIAYLSAVYTSLIAFGAGSFARWLAQHRRIGRWQGKVVGGIYLGLGVKLALQER
jgi:threonine/homoserine/homoserine lactone efflux protein